MGLKKSLIILLFVCFMAACGGESADAQRILFAGNSYTDTNNLPRTFARLAESGGHTVETGMVAPGGWWLQDHLNSTEVRNNIKDGNWQIVVLQEQSVVPAMENERVGNMYPAVRGLHELIQQAGAQTFLFMTWGRRDGTAPPDTGFQTFSDMQTQLGIGYMGIADELSVPVIPVGVAWRDALAQQPTLALWQSDGSHPSEAGTYLAACTFYAAIFQQSPEGLAYTGGLDEETAVLLQKIAADTVLTNLEHWHIPLLATE